MSLNEFLCKHAQPDLKDANGDVIKKPDGTPYKKGKVTIGDAIWHLIIKNIITFTVIYLFFVVIGGALSQSVLSIKISDIILNYIGINNVPWYHIWFLNGLITISGIIIVIYIFIELWTAEIAVCPHVEKPPEKPIAPKKEELSHEDCD